MDKEKQYFKMIKDGFDSISKSIHDISNKIIPTKEIELKGVSMLKGDKGDDGHTPTDNELLSLIRPLIPQVKDGETPSDTRLLSLIRPMIPQVKDGETPSDARLLSLIKPLIPQVKDGYSPVKGKDYRDGKDGSPDTPKEIKEKILTLRESWIPIDMIEGDFNTKVRPPVIVPGNRPLEVSANGVDYGITRKINFESGFTVTESNNGINVIGLGGSGGMSILPFTGTINGSNTTFACATEPTLVCIDGLLKPDVSQNTPSEIYWSWSGGVLTIDSNSTPYQFIIPLR